MATSGVREINLSVVKLIFSWEVASQNGMESTIAWTIKEQGYVKASPGTGVNAPYMMFWMNEYSSITGEGASLDDGTVYPVAVNANATKTLLSGTFKINRSTSTNNVRFRFSYRCGGLMSNANTGTTYDLSEGNWPAYATFTVDSITAVDGEVTILSVPTTFTDEDSPEITYEFSKSSSAATAKLELGMSLTNSSTISNLDYRTIPASSINTYTLTFTDGDKVSLYNRLQYNTSQTVYFIIRVTETTSAGEELVTTKSAPATLNFINYKPTFSPKIYDVNENTIRLTGDKNKLVRYASSVNYEINATPNKGGKEIISQYILNNGKDIVENIPVGNLGEPASNTFYLSATDDRGYTGTDTYALDPFTGEFINYIKPTCIASAYTPISGEGKVTVNITGKYFDANFGAAQNKMTLQYAIVDDDNEQWTTPTIIEPEIGNESTYSYDFEITGLDYTKNHTIKVRVQDLLLESVYTFVAISRPLFDWSRTDFRFHIPVTIEGATVDTIVEQGTTTAYYISSSGTSSSAGLSWNYIKWSSGLLECWCTVPLSTTINTAWGNMYVAATQYKTDLNYPIQPKETPFIMVTIGAGGTKGMLIADNSYAADNISTGRYNIASPVAVASSTTFRLNYYVRGKWK